MRPKPWAARAFTTRPHPETNGQLSGPRRNQSARPAGEQTEIPLKAASSPHGSRLQPAQVFPTSSSLNIQLEEGRSPITKAIRAEL